MIDIAKVEKNEDLSRIIRLIYETDDYIYPSMCNSDYNLFEVIMQKILLTESIFSYKNIIIASENRKTIGILLYLTNKSKIPDSIDNYIDITKEQTSNFNYVIHDYFTPLLSKIKDDCIYINNLCVDKNNRRQGVAEKLINYLLKMYPEKNIVLDCLEDNIAAVNFYQKCGFLITERFLGFAGKLEEQVKCIKLEYSHR